MRFDPTDIRTDDASSADAARAQLVLASIAFVGGLRCLGEQYLDDALAALERAAAATQAQMS